MSRRRVLSLFSGIGGLDLGLQNAGFTIAGQVEIDPWCRKVLAKHWPEVPRHDDVRTAAGWWLGTTADVADTRSERCDGGKGIEGTRGNPAIWQQTVDHSGDSRSARRAAGDDRSPGGRPAPDLVCGGFPCQPVSLAGKGLAQADSRWLWPAFAGVIRRLRPMFVLVENVPGLLGRGMGDVLGDLASLGYDAEWDSVPAAYVGAPHIRNRVWIVAYPQGNRCGASGPLGAAEAGADAAPGGAGQQSGVLANAYDDQPNQPQSQVWPADQRAIAGRRSLGPGRPDWWATEPGVGRVAHGIPARVDRLRGLGNAVVPQVAEHIGRLIMTAMEADAA